MRIKAKFGNMPIDSETPVGTLVRPSEHAVRPKRDYWNGCGRMSEKSAAKEALDKEIAKRGVLVAHTPNKWSATGIKVQWDDGTESNCLSYMVMTA